MMEETGPALSVLSTQTLQAHICARILSLSDSELLKQYDGREAGSTY